MQRINSLFFVKRTTYGRMKTSSWGLMAMVVVLIFGSCEELIDLDIGDAPSKVVIEANVSSSGPSYVSITRTTSVFEDSDGANPEETASVYVTRDDGLVFPFYPVTIPGMYAMVSDPFVAAPSQLVPGHAYTLHVDIGDDQYTATDYMYPYVDVDSTGTGVRNIFDDDIYYASLRFKDPLGEQNYYRYDVAINDGDYIYSSVFNDRFNDGLQVVHEVLSPDNNVRPGDVMRVRRSVISKPVYQYWNDLQSINPGSAAPANPRSNISNGALGYFSVNSSQIYEFTVRQFVPPDSDNEEDNAPEDDD